MVEKQESRHSPESGSAVQSEAPHSVTGDLESQPVDSSGLIESLMEQVSSLMDKIALLKQQLNKLPDSPSTKELRFSFSDIARDDALVRFYTGVPDREHFDALSEFLSDCSSTMPLWRGSGCHDGNARSQKSSRTLTLDDELLLTLMKLRLDTPNVDLAMRFRISTSMVSRIFTAWLMSLFKKFTASAELPVWPSRERVNDTMPEIFKDLYPTTRCIIDCTEFPIQTPTDPDTQRVTWSSYKNRNTFKALVGITPSGAISFLSELYGGSVSDREITLSSGLLDKLQSGDSLMADKGFTIADECLKCNILLDVPPYVHDKQLSAQEIVEARRIASLRIHVERAME